MNPNDGAELRPIKTATGRDEDKDIVVGGLADDDRPHKLLELNALKTGALLGTARWLRDDNSMWDVVLGQPASRRCFVGIAHGSSDLRHRNPAQTSNLGGGSVSFSPHRPRGPVEGGLSLGRRGARRVPGRAVPGCTPRASRVDPS